MYNGVKSDLTITNNLTIYHKGESIEEYSNGCSHNQWYIINYESMTRRLGISYYYHDRQDDQFAISKPYRYNATTEMFENSDDTDALHQFIIFNPFQHYMSRSQPDPSRLYTIEDM